LRLWGGESILLEKFFLPGKYKMGKNDLGMGFEECPLEI
jgi:hypothetical protein